MIEIGYNFLKKDLDKMQKFKNPTLDIVKSKINKNSKYRIFLNKTQFNNLLEQGFIKYKLTDSKKKQNISVGDGIGSLLKMALPFVKSIAPKVLGTVGLSSIGALTSNAINKKMNKKNKDTIIRLSQNQVKKINQSLDKINKLKIFDRKITLDDNEEQVGEGIFSILIPTIAILLPSLLSSGKGVSKKRIFFEVKSKYPLLFDRKKYPLSNIFINNLLKNEEQFSGVFSKDKIILLDNNKSLIYNLQISSKGGSHWCSITRRNNTIYVFDSFGIGEIISEIYKIYKGYDIITNIYRIQDIDSNLCGLFSVSFCLYKIDSKNKFISFLNLFNSNNFLKN